MGLWNLDIARPGEPPRISHMRSEGTGESGRSDAREDLWRLDDRMERLLLLSEAVWELTAPALGLSDEHLAAKMAEIDGRDGPVDGRRNRQARTCPECQAAIQKGRSTCMFCGAEQATAPDPFDVI